MKSRAKIGPAHTQLQGLVKGERLHPLAAS